MLVRVLKSWLRSLAKNTMSYCQGKYDVAPIFDAVSMLAPVLVTGYVWICRTLRRVRSKVMEPCAGISPLLRSVAVVV
ncbi:hypothetical protein E3N88_43036 [Mikania micrantha]|uniref:Uncharacterized protein n=1 Tax=Mikania micrantha TaxID=192012 RepID=A0A5N6LG33_9ASTR|nr:hypothetical protein E3N88_43036 [Mikania micrantha]